MTKISTIPSDFYPMRTDYYPGPYSPNTYKVAVAYFSKDDLSTAVDIAVMLQEYYSGELNRQDFISKINNVERLGDETQSSVAIYDGTTYFSKTNFIQRFVIEFIYTDEVFLVGNSRDSLFEEYIIAACKLMVVPIFRIKLGKNGLYKETINEAEVNIDALKFFEKELIDKIESDGPIDEIVIGNDYGITCYAMTKTGEHSSTDLIFPHVPLQVTRRIEEWDNSIDYGFTYDFYEIVDLAELDNLVGILNYFAGEKYKFKTQDGNEGYFIPSKKEG